MSSMQIIVGALLLLAACGSFWLPYWTYHIEELRKRLDAALKMADDWEGRDVAGWLCADELRAIFKEKT